MRVSLMCCLFYITFIQEIFAEIHPPLVNDSETVEQEKSPAQASEVIVLPVMEVPESSQDGQTDENSIEFAIDDIKVVPGSGGDPFRALQVLPGIFNTDDLSSQPAVRGTNADANLYYIDAMPSRYVFHVDGNVSVLQNELIDAFLFMPAAFGPEYGDAIGAVFHIKQKEPFFDRWQRKVGLSLLGSEFIVDGPIDDNKAMFVGFRRSFLDIALDVTNFEDNSSTELTNVPQYIDYQTKAIWEINSRHDLILLASGAKDEVSVNERRNNIAYEDSETTEYHTQSIQWQSHFDASRRNTFVFSHVYDSDKNDEMPFEHSQVKTHQYRFSNQLQQKIKQHTYLFGGEWTKRDIDFSLFEKNFYCNRTTEGCPANADAQFDDTVGFNQWALYVKDRWDVTQSLSMTSGLRYSAEDYLDRWYVEPRFRWQWQATAQAQFFAAWGRYHQMPQVRKIVKTFGNPNLTHIRATHAVLGMRHVLSNWEFQSELYLKNIKNMVVRDRQKNFVNKNIGKALGVELLLKSQMTSRLTGWLSLTLSRSEETLKTNNTTIRSAIDLPVVTSWVLDYQLANLWSLGLKWHYHSGAPYTPLVGTKPVDENDPNSRVFAIFGERHSARLPAYHRLDIKLSKIYHFPSWQLETNFELINAYNRKNVLEYEYSNQFKTREARLQLPLLISFGLVASF